MAAVSRKILHQEGFYPEESAGLFVGISTFKDQSFASVRFAADDAVDLAWVFSLVLGLVDTSRCVLALSGEPQKEASRSRLEELLAAGARCERPGLTEIYRLASELSQSGGERGLFVLAAATHGISEQGGDYLIAADSRHDRLLRTAIPIEELFGTAAMAAARRRLLVLDACRERLIEKRALADPAMSHSFAAGIAKAAGLTVLAGSTAGGYSYDDLDKKNGVFTGALVEGMLGAAPADSRGFITIATLAVFAQERVQAWVRQHRPKHSELSRGIEKRFDEMAEHLPLAIHPQRARRPGDYLERGGFLARAGGVGVGLWNEQQSAKPRRFADSIRSWRRIRAAASAGESSSVWAPTQGSGSKRSRRAASAWAGKRQLPRQAAAGSAARRQRRPAPPARWPSARLPE